MKILIVDDSAITRDYIKKELSSIKGVEIIEAASGREGIDKTLEHIPDVITMDVNMPEMDGITVAGKIRRYHNCSHIPIIFITGLADEKTRKQAFDVGAVEFFTKPFGKGALKAYIQTLNCEDELLSSLNILYVDDSKILRGLVSRVLKEKGANVILAENGEDAIEKLKKNFIDVIITDIVMPKMDGIDLCKYIRGDLKNVEIPIIILTSLSDQSVEIEAISSGADDFLIKPFSREELIARIKNHSRLVKLHKKLHKEITIRKEKEEELEKHKNELEKIVKERTKELSEANNRLKVLDKAKGEFLKLISHELRTPLNGLCVTVDLLMEGNSELDEEKKELLEIYEKSKERLLSIIEKAMLLTNLEMSSEKFSIEENDLDKAIIAGIVAMENIAKEKDLTISYDDGNSFPVLSEKGLLDQALISTLNTALHFSENGSEINISCGKVRKEVILRITTIGKTISVSALPYFFDHDSTEISQELGDDICLDPHLVKNILLLFKGSVSVENNDNGVTFLLRLKHP